MSFFTSAVPARHQNNPEAARSTRGLPTVSAGSAQTSVADHAVKQVGVAHMPFGAVVARQLSVWPFAARTTRLFLLIDPSLPDVALRRGLLRAMQQAYFASDGYSQTRAVRESALAAHYVLRHHNRDVLTLQQINAASAVAALRGDVAFVALAGHAVAFAWRAGELTGQRGVLRFPRPLGLEQDPLITLWSTPLEIGDRLVLVCGASWRPDSAQAIKDILASAPSPESAEEQLAEALGQSRPAGVLVISPRTESRDARQLRLLPSAAPRPPAPALPDRLVQQAPAAAPGRLRRATRTWLPALAGILLLAGLVATALATSSGARHQPSAAPEAAAANLTRVDRVDPAMAVRLGPSAANVIDLAVGDDAVYTLDTVEASVRAFTLDGLDQQPTPETLIARPGAPISGTSRQLTTPVAIEYVQGASPGDGALTLIDQARSVVQIGRDHRLNPRVVPSSARWLDIGALGAGPTGDLFVLDARSRAVLAYQPLGQRPADPPRIALDATTAPNLLFEHAAEIVGEADSVVVRMDNGSVHRFDTQGVEQPLLAAGTRLARISAIASDRIGGLYLVDAASARVLQLSADGNLLRELRDPGLAGLRAIQASLDGQRLYGLVASGIMVFDIPPL